MQKALSDMDYLKSKVVRARSPSSSEGEQSKDEAVSCDGSCEAEEEDSCAAPTQQDHEGTGPSPEQGTPSGNKKPQEARAKVCVDQGVLEHPGEAGEGSAVPSPAFPAVDLGPAARCCVS